MQLLLLLLLFGVIGYLLAGSDFRERVDRTAGHLSAASGSWWTRSTVWWRSRFSRKVSADEFRTWVTGQGAAILPEEFKQWYLALPGPQAQDFVYSLADYADGLGYNLMQLVAGGLEHKPVMKQVFVEAIVVYSDAYRKAKEARKQAEDERPQPEAEDQELQPAEKSASRRQRQKVAETAEAAPAA
jgi:hypothetical protein